MRSSPTYAWCDQCGNEPAPPPPARQQFHAPNGWFQRIFSPRQRGQIVQRTNRESIFQQGQYRFPIEVDQMRIDQTWMCSIHETAPRFIRQDAAWRRRMDPIINAYEFVHEEVTLRNGLPREQRRRGEANLTNRVGVYRLRRPPPTTMTRMWPR